MAFEFRLPDVGEGIAEVEIVEWLVGVGEPVREDQPVVTVQTDKALVEMPTPVAGTLTAVAGQPGEVVSVGATLFAIAPAPPGPEPVPGGATGAEPVPTAERIRVKAAPSVRRYAAEHGVDVQTVIGTGPGGRVSREDVERAAGDAHPPVPGDAHLPVPGDAHLPVPGDAKIPLRGLRRQIAQHTLESWRTIPHITDWRQVDATGLIQARDALRQAHPALAARLTYLPILVKIVATALVAHPLLNASLSASGEDYELHQHVHVGIATATPDGLLVPVLRHADRKSVPELAVELDELVTLARARKASHAQLTGGTYTVNNFGALGTVMGTPIIRSPEVGILGFGRICDAVVAAAGVPVVRPTMTVSSVADHRLLDGDTLGSFTAEVVQLIQEPVRLLGQLR